MPTAKTKKTALKPKKDNLAKSTKGRKAITDKVMPVKNIVVNAKVDDEACLPMRDSAFGFDLKVSANKSKELTIPPRMSFVLDGGLSVEIPDGYRLQVQTTPELVDKGLHLSMNTYPSGGMQRVAVHATNVGKQILSFEHGQVIAKFWFSKAEPVALKFIK